MTSERSNDGWPGNGTGSGLFSGRGKVEEREPFVSVVRGVRDVAQRRIFVFLTAQEKQVT